MKLTVYHSVFVQRLNRKPAKPSNYFFKSILLIELPSFAQIHSNYTLIVGNLNRKITSVLNKSYIYKVMCYISNLLSTKTVQKKEIFSSPHIIAIQHDTIYCQGLETDLRFFCLKRIKLFIFRP